MTDHSDSAQPDLLNHPNLGNVASNSERPVRRVRFRSKTDVFEPAAAEMIRDDGVEVVTHSFVPLKAQSKASTRWQGKRVSFMAYYPLLICFLLALAILHHSSLFGGSHFSSIGVFGGAIPVSGSTIHWRRSLIERADSSTDVCTRWSQQTAIVNGTLYVYGGRSKQESSQTDNTWNNDFLTLDVTKSWDISSPALSGLPQPSGPPAVANGYIWHSYSSLFLYGGEYSDTPVASPSPYSLWEYDISASKWIEHQSPQTSTGNASDGGNQNVQQSAEGAGISVPSLGKGWYFGGHLDGYTTSGWSQSIARVYLKSMIEFTFPGFSNNAINSLQGGKAAGSDGAWRNITAGGLQESKGFTERADGVLVYIPGYGEQGIIIGLAGGTNTSFTQMNVIDVYDVANSNWYKQSTQGGPPKIRVNPCAVAASAPDGSSTNVYLYGGQNLIPYDQQIQYDDMWILTIPSFTWIQVDDSDSNPYARAGHSCEAWDGQMVVVGGYVGTDISCDSPGVYVFDMSNLKWQTSFTAIQGSNDQSQQLSQAGDKSGLAGSYGYQVPEIVQKIIGGDGNGGATVTAPAAGATSGPLKTGAPIVYTMTATGATITQTAISGSNGDQSSGNGGPNIAAIVAGVVAGVFFVIACYLGFCAWVYRRQLQLYKNHVAVAQRAAVAGPNEKTGFLGAQRSSEDPSSSGPRSTAANSNPSSTSHNARTPASIPPLPTPPDRRDSNSGSSTDDIFLSQEPSFMGVMMSPRKSLRVINRD